jgi:hypothetical protein
MLTSYCCFFSGNPRLYSSLVQLGYETEKQDSAGTEEDAHSPKHDPESKHAGRRR